MGKNSKNSKKTRSKKSSSKKSTSTADKATRDALEVTQANIARIEAVERGETPLSSATGVARDEAPGIGKRSKRGALTTARLKAEKPPKAKKSSLVDHAVAILRKSGKPSNCKELVEKVKATSDWKTKGKTPWATLYSAILREIAEKKSESRFKKVDRGMFAYQGA